MLVKCCKYARRNNTLAQCLLQMTLKYLLTKETNLVLSVLLRSRTCTKSPVKWQTTLKKELDNYYIQYLYVCERSIQCLRTKYSSSHLPDKPPKCHSRWKHVMVCWSNVDYLNTILKQSNTKTKVFRELSLIPIFHYNTIINMVIVQRKWITRYNNLIQIRKEI